MLKRWDCLLICSATGLSLIKRLGLPESEHELILQSGEPDISILSAKNIEEVRQCHFVVAIGGGSIIDSAKILLAAADLPNLSDSLAMGSDINLSLSKLSRTLIVVPTTGGSGSEVSSAATISVSGSKRVLYGPALTPSGVAYVPELLPMSLEQNSSALLDILGHAIESRFSFRQSTHLEALAAQSIKIVLGLSGSKALSIEERARLQLAGLTAGRVQDLQSVSAPHALAHLWPYDNHGSLVGHFNLQLLENLQHFDVNVTTFLHSFLERWNIDLDELKTVLKSLGAVQPVNMSALKPTLNLDVIDQINRSPSMRLSRLKLGPSTLQILLGQGND